MPTFAKSISPALEAIDGSTLIYIDFSKDNLELGGSSFAQVLNQMGTRAPRVLDAPISHRPSKAVQSLIAQGTVLAGHDISAGGLATTLLEMCFAVPGVGMNISLKESDDLVPTLFSERPGIVIQVGKTGTAIAVLEQHGVEYEIIGRVTMQRELTVWAAPSNFISTSIDYGTYGSKLRTCSTGFNVRRAR